MSTGEVSGDEAAWRDLVARYDIAADPAEGMPPWPERENLTDPAASPAIPDSATSVRAGQDAGAATDTQPDAQPVTDGQPDTQPARSYPKAESAHVIRHAVRAPRHGRFAPRSGAGSGEDPADDRYVPPAPPPLPQLDPVAKGAWAALFGGPGYLIVATVAGWSVPGWAALLAVAAFVGGFAVVIMRMGDGPSRGDGPDGGAVV